MVSSLALTETHPVSGGKNSFFAEAKHVTSSGVFWSDVEICCAEFHRLLQWLIFCGSGFSMNCSTEEVMLWVWRSPGYFQNKVLSWEWGSLLFSYPWHSKTASKALGFLFLMLQGCSSTLGLFKRIVWYKFLILLRISLKLTIWGSSGSFFSH